MGMRAGRAGLLLLIGCAVVVLARGTAAADEGGKSKKAIQVVGDLWESLSNSVSLLFDFTHGTCCHEGERENCGPPVKQADGTKKYEQEWCNAHVVYAFWCVIGIFVVLLVVMARYAAWAWDFIAVYRPSEEKLLREGRLRLSDVLDYHAQYHWGDYAAITIGMVLVSVTLIAVEGKSLQPTATAVQAVAVLTMVVAAVLLTYADLVHTNTQTPIIPIDRRFKLIDMSVQFGTIGTMLTFVAVLLFVALISLWATIVACICYVLVLYAVQKKRRIPKDEFEAYFGVGPDWHKRRRSLRERFERFLHGDREADTAFPPYEQASPEARLLLRRTLVDSPDNAPAVADLLGVSQPELEVIEAEMESEHENLQALADSDMDAELLEALKRLLGHHA